MFSGRAIMGGMSATQPSLIQRVKYLLGRPLPDGMREWAIVGWYGMASFAAIRATCCPASSPELHIPFKDAKERWVSSFEREYIHHLLKQNRGNISHAARQADIDRKYFRKLMRKYAIEVEGAEPFDDED